MEIGRHVILGYDLKLPPSDGDSSTVQDRTRWERSFGRLTDRQQEAWHTAYAASNRAFRETKLTGQDLVRWKYQRYIVQDVENRKARVGSAERGGAPRQDSRRPWGGGIADLFEKMCSISLS